MKVNRCCTRAIVIGCGNCNKLLCDQHCVEILVTDLNDWSCTEQVCKDAIRERLRKHAFEAHVTTYEELKRENES